MDERKESFQRPKAPYGVLYWILRVTILFSLVTIFFSDFNPGRVLDKISKYLSLFTMAVSRNDVTSALLRPLDQGWLSGASITILQISCAAIILGILLSTVSACMTMGNVRMRAYGLIFSLAGSVVMLIGTVGTYLSYGRCASELIASGKADKYGPRDPSWALYFYIVVAVVILVLSLINYIGERKEPREAKFEMLEKYKLFLYILPILLMSVVFSYLPLWGWRYAFYDYSAGDALTAENFVGFKWFKYLFENSATRADIVRVLRNTLAMSGLGVLTSWFPVAFAILLSEIRSTGFRKTVQILTTIPNFISWVLVYALAFALFSTDGFVNDFIEMVTGRVANVNYLQLEDLQWLKMLLWGTWKGLGWSAIIYIAAISGVDQSLYEAAMVDGAGRFKRMWNITVPALVPTYCVMLMLSIANILSNGMEQYLVFSNPMTNKTLEVLDLYVYNLGIGGGQIPLSTVVSMTKSIVSVTLLFVANKVSKSIRGESII